MVWISQAGAVCVVKAKYSPRARRPSARALPELLRQFAWPSPGVLLPAGQRSEPSQPLDLWHRRIRPTKLGSSRLGEQGLDLRPELLARFLLRGRRVGDRSRIAQAGQCRFGLPTLEPCLKPLALLWIAHGQQLAVR